MSENIVIGSAAFFTVTSFVVMLSVLFRKRTNLVDARVESLAGQTSGTGNRSSVEQARKSNSSGFLSSVLPTREDGRKVLGERLIQAGLYRRNSVTYYVIVKLVLMIIPIACALFLSSSGIVPLLPALFFGGATAILGTIFPSFWLDQQKKNRQSQIRRALPDAVDVMVVCVEAGLTVPAALARVSNELATAHPMLAAELVIVKREIQLGASTGEGLRRFADRFDIEELRSLSSVIQQAEKYGASIISALRVHAESLRTKRFQRAEERGRQATVKLLFPTVFFIFPALFVVLIGPAAYDLFEMIGVLQESARSAAQR